MYFWENKYPNLKYLNFFIFIIFLMIMYFISVVEVEILKEACPLNVNILLYFALVMLFLLISFWLSIGIFTLISKIGISIKETEETIYMLVAFNSILTLRIINLILPEWMLTIALWLNLRILYLMATPNIILHIIVNTINKRMSKSFTSEESCISILDLISMAVLKYQFLYHIRFHINFIIYMVVILLILGYITIIFQYKYGTRFFLPNWWRTKRFEYRRRIWEDFDLTKIDEIMWPEWVIWMRKLHQSSLHSNGRSLNDIEGSDCFGKYTKTENGLNLHYFWLEWLINNSSNLGLQLYKIDEFDD